MRRTSNVRWLICACVAFLGAAHAHDTLQLAQHAYIATCAGCHGVDRQGKSGVPNLADKFWLWGRDAASIEQIIRHGIRTPDPQTRQGVMPGFKHNDAELTDANIADLIVKLTQLAGRKADAQAVERAEENWVWCVDCHGKEGKGVQSIGGPDLTDKEWLYGGDKKSIAESIAEGRKGICPGGPKLDEKSIKALAQWLANAK